MHTYSPREERANSLSHGIAALLALGASIYMLSLTSQLGLLANSAIMLYGISLVLLFSGSYCYHSAKDPARKVILKRLDHCAIYFLIAGTYTPFMVLSLKTEQAYILLAVEWLLALIGSFFKLFFIHRFKVISLLAYLIMGWLVLFVASDLKQTLNEQGFQLLVAGGLAYSIGAVFYALKKIPYTHTIWHLFVIAGAFLHCASVAFYVIP